MEAAQRVGVGVGTLVTRDDRVLLVRRKHSHGSGTWSTPGGHLDFGESLEACAVREVFEETGVQVTDVRFHAVTNDVMIDEAKHYLTVWMKAQYVSGEARVAAAYEMSDVGWFSWDDLPRPLFICFQNLIDGACYRASTAPGA